MTSPIPGAGSHGPPPPFLFDAVLQPHRSLSPAGFAILMAAVSLICFVAGAVFVIAGAWPVMGFFGLDVLLIYIAFRVNYGAARRYETVRLTEETLVVERVTPNGQRQTWRFQPYWLRVAMDDPPRHDSKIVLSSHGRSLVIGAFLSPSERLEFAQALRGALDRLRQPAPSAPA
jgi:uncharacterized membrane protein